MSKITNIWGEEIDTPTPQVDKRTHHQYKDLVYFDENRINLAQECKSHPVLMELISKHAQEEFEVIIAEVAAYCEVGLNDAYTPKDLDHLCKVLTDKLVIKRGGIVFARELPPDLKE